VRNSKRRGRSGLSINNSIRHQCFFFLKKKCKKKQPYHKYNLSISHQVDKLTLRGKFFKKIEIKSTTSTTYQSSINLMSLTIKPHLKKRKTKRYIYTTQLCNFLCFLSFPFFNNANAKKEKKNINYLNTKTSHNSMEKKVRKRRKRALYGFGRFSAMSILISVLALGLVPI
jgi:hypothetical protein